MNVWNKGLTKETDKRLRLMGEKVTVSKKKTPSLICYKCNSQISKCNYNRHIKTCTGIIKTPNYLKYLEVNNKYKCPYCFEEYNKSGIGSHIWRKHTEKGQKHNSNIGYIKGTRKIWSKGLTKETDMRVARIGRKVSETLIKQYKEGKRKEVKFTDAFLKRLSVKQSLHNSGGRSKWYNVSNQKVQGTWERDLALKFEEFKIQWYKLKCNKDIWPYIMNGKKRSYTPDFYLQDLDVYLEPKGYWWGNDKEKIQIVKKKYPNRKLIIIDDEELFNRLIKCSVKEEFLKLIASDV